MLKGEGLGGPVELLLPRLLPTMTVPPNRSAGHSNRSLSTGTPPSIGGILGVAVSLENTPSSSSSSRVRSSSSTFKRASAVALTPSLAQIADKEVTVDVLGSHKPLPFKLGGKMGNIITKSTRPDIHRGWRVIKIAGKRLQPGDVEAALSQARAQHKFTVTFRMGEPLEDGSRDQEDNLQALALERQARREAVEQERRRQVELAEAEQEQSRLAAEEVERVRLEAERAARDRAALEEENLREVERRMKEAAQAEVQWREAQADVDRLRLEAEEMESRKEAELERQRQATLDAQRRAKEAKEREEAEEAKRRRRKAAEAEAEAQREAEEREKERRRREREEQEEQDRRRREKEEEERKEQERRRREEEEEEQRKQKQREAEEALARSKLEAEEAEAARRRKQEEEEQQKRREQEEQRRREEAEEQEREQQRRRRMQEEQEEEEKRRRIKEEEEARQAAQRCAEAAERAKKQKEEEEAAKKEVQERQKQAVAKAAAAAKAAAEEEERKAREAKELAEEQRRRTEEEERKSKQQEEEDARKAEEAAMEKKKSAELLIQRQGAEKTLAASAGLPPRDKVAEPQKALLAALTRPPPAPKKMGPCDKCDGPHHADDCPHFKKPREKHNDAWAKYGKDAGSGEGDAPVVVQNAKVIPQPGDGSCLFHSLCFGLPGSAQATQLRAEISDYIAANPSVEVAGNPIRDWVLWDSGMDAVSYARSMRSGNRWGGAVEIAVCAKVRGVTIDVYEKTRGGFTRISSFTGGSSTVQRVNLAYGGRAHYDALRLP